MSEYLTKQQLLEGAAHVEEVSTEIGIVRVRPLTNGEQAAAEAIAMKGVKAKGRAMDLNNPEVELNPEQGVRNDWQFIFHVAACGMSIDKHNKWTVKELENSTIKKTILLKLVDRIKDISGMTEVAEARARDFRKDAGGPEVDGADSDGAESVG